MKRSVPALLIVALFVFIVVLIARSPAEQTTETPEAVEIVETTSTPPESPPPATSTHPAATTSPRRTSGSSTSTSPSSPTATSTPTPAPPPPPAPTRIAFTIEADDNEFAPREIRAPRGATVSLTFRVRSTNVYFGGLDIRSTAFTTGTIPPGGMKTVSFIANASFDFSSYWPLTNTLKTTGHVIVE